MNHPTECTRDGYLVRVPTGCEDEYCEAVVEVHVAWYEGSYSSCEVAGYVAEAPNICPACEAELDPAYIHGEAIDAVCYHIEALRDEAADNQMDAQRAGD